MRGNETNPTNTQHQVIIIFQAEFFSLPLKVILLVMQDEHPSPFASYISISKKNLYTDITWKA